MRIATHEFLESVKTNTLKEKLNYTKNIILYDYRHIAANITIRDLLLALSLLPPSVTELSPYEIYHFENKLTSDILAQGLAIIPPSVKILDLSWCNFYKLPGQELANVLKSIPR